MGICIYCRKDSSDSKSQAHIIPEALLRNNVTLPLGVECDACNSYAAQLEQAFVHHNRIWVPIMMLRAPGKSGKKRKQLGHFVADDVNKIVTAKYQESWVESHEGQNRIAFPDPPEFDEHKFRRCLGHIGLNYVAWKFGCDIALEARLDPLRSYVRQGTRNVKWPYGQVSYKDSEPRKTLSIGWEKKAPGLTVKIETYIDDFYIDVLNTGELKLWMNSCEGVEIHYFGD